MTHFTLLYLSCLFIVWFMLFTSCTLRIVRDLCTLLLILSFVYDIHVVHVMHI
jgi:hypothetical protein